MKLNINGKETACTVIKFRPREVIAATKGAPVPAKAASWAILNGAQAVIDETASGDAAERNFGLAIFEQALDWAIGLKVLPGLLAIMRGYREKNGKPSLPKEMAVAVTRKGDVHLLWSDLRQVRFA